MDTSAVITSAGSSTRMGVNKQLLPIGDTNVIGLSMLAFEKAPSIAEIIIVTREEDFDAVRETAAKLNITKLVNVVSGGDTRQKSVFNGVRKTSEATKLIAVHDGARPLVTPEIIERTIADARVFGAATAGMPVKDTIKTVSGGLITDTPDRSSLYITQTPQVFKKSVYFRGMEFSLEHSLDFTDDCQLAEAVGIKVCMTEGSYTNIKITTPEDIIVARAIMGERGAD